MSGLIVKGLNSKDEKVAYDRIIDVLNMEIDSLLF